MHWNFQPILPKLLFELLIIFLPSFERSQRLSVCGDYIFFIGALPSALLAIKSFVILVLDGAN